MKTALPFLRAMCGFLFGILALFIPFIVISCVAVLRAQTSHGSPAADDYRFAATAIGLLTMAFGAGISLIVRGGVSHVPCRTAAIAGAGSVALLLITSMLVGEPLGIGGASVVAVAVGLAASWLMCRISMQPRAVPI